MQKKLQRENLSLKNVKTQLKRSIHSNALITLTKIIQQLTLHYRELMRIFDFLLHLQASKITTKTD